MTVWLFWLFWLWLGGALAFWLWSAYTAGKRGEPSTPPVVVLSGMFTSLFWPAFVLHSLAEGVGEIHSEKKDGG